jgi:hypothetical protein
LRASPVAGRARTEGGIPWRGCGALGLGPATGGAPVEVEVSMSTSEAASQPASAWPRLPGASTKERMAVLYRMSPDERRAAARGGELTCAEACKWAGRYPHEVELVDGEFWFIAQRTPEATEAS